MKITALMEDTAQNGFYCEHGLSLFIETENHRILLDTGASEKTFDNAEKLNIDVKTVDSVIISHGHYDHAGGLLSFCERGGTAEIYIKNSAFGRFYHGTKYIGVDGKIADLPQLKKITENNTIIDEELSVFSGVTGRKLYPSSNAELTEKTADGEICDTFSHEQYLVVAEKEKRVLFSGCAHNGIVNIIEKFFEIYGSYPDAVVSGFHLTKKTEYKDEDISLIKKTAKVLSEMPTLFYTGHCTGRQAFEIMKEIMGEKLSALQVGCSFRI